MTDPRDIMALYEQASEQYDNYLRLTETRLEQLTEEETWEHKPNAPLSIHLIPRPLMISTSQHS